MMWQQEIKKIGDYTLVRMTPPGAGAMPVFVWIRPEGTQAECQSDFNAIGAAVWEMTEMKDS
jgi:hypothetical protein